MADNQTNFKDREAFRLLIEQMPVATAIYLGRELEIAIANDIIIGYWGKGKGIIGLPLEKALPELQGQPFLQVLDDVFTSGGIAEFKEAKVELESDGILKTYYFDFTYKALRDAAGNVYAILNTAIDVTEQVLAKWKLEKSQQEIVAYFEQAPVAIAMIARENLVFTMANPFYGELVGRKPQELENKSLLDALPELKGQGFDQLLQGVIDTGIAYTSHEVPVDILRHGKLEKLYVNLTYQPQRDIRSVITGILVVATEVTAQVNARRQLEETDSALRGAIDLANLGTWSLNVRSRILSYDERLRKWFGFSSDEVITAERAYAPILEHCHEAVKTSMLNAITPGTDGKYDVEYTAKNLETGHEIIIHAQGMAFYDQQDEPYIVTGTARDITKERKIELELKKLVQEQTEQLQAANEEMQATNEEIAATNEELEEANLNLYRSNEELSQYAYVASHDLQEPLRKIRVFSGMLSEQKSLTAENRKLVEKIDASSARMSLLIKDLLEFSRLIKSEQMLRPVDLNQTLTEVLTDFELLITEKKAQITAGKLPEIEAVGLQMNQLFYNLIGNALKFVDKNTRPQIAIKATRISYEKVKALLPKAKTTATYYDITITDNGIGFDTKFSEQIFEVFKRLHGKDIFPGSGIGLALCRRIVVNHGGILYANSEVGKGTTFHLILPTYFKTTAHVS